MIPYFGRSLWPNPQSLLSCSWFVFKNTSTIPSAATGKSLIFSSHASLLQSHPCLAACQWRKERRRIFRPARCFEASEAFYFVAVSVGVKQCIGRVIDVRLKIASRRDGDT
jgi:hypothetical protein